MTSSVPVEPPPPPDPNKAYIFVGGEWLLVATDTSDGVPDSLEFEADDDADAAGKSLDPGEQDIHHALVLVDPTTRAKVLELIAKEQARDRRGRFAGGGSGGAGGGVGTGTNMAGGTLRSSVPGAPGGPPVPRASLAATKTADEAAAVASAELEKVMGRPVSVDFAGMSPAMARETGEGLLIAAHRYPNNDLRSVTTYGPGGTRPSDPRDPTFESGAFTSVAPFRHGDEMAFNVIGGEGYIRSTYKASASMGQNSVPSPTGTAVHEMGHVVSMHGTAPYTVQSVIIDDAVMSGGAKTSQDVAAHIARHVSIYAASGPEEALAEAFADVLVNGANASPLSQAIHAETDTDYQVNSP